MSLLKKKAFIPALVAVLVIATLAVLMFGMPRSEAAERATEGLTMPTVFDDDMVFQRGEEINVFGYSDIEGGEISVTLGDATATATVVGGEWLATLPPMEATFGLALTVSEVGVDSPKTLTFRDVAVGEVFLVSGQSNAALEAYHLEDLEEHMDLIDDYKNLRLYTSVPNLLPNESTMGYGSWHKASRMLITSSTEGASRRFSAIGVVVGMRLCDELGPDVPVAVMTAARGSSKIRAWLSYDTLSSIAPLEAGKVDVERESFKEGGSWTSAAGSKPHVNIGTVCYNSMIAPLENFKIAGVIWHQGEGDVKGECFGDGGDYTNYFTTLVNSWREHFDVPDLPFFMVQIGSYNIDIPDQVSEFKAEQYDIAASLDGVYLVPTGFDDCAFTLKDSVAQLFIHPVRKAPLSNRLASIIIEKMYTEGEVEFTSLPLVESVKWVNRYTVVKFNVPIKLAYGTTVIGFEQYNGSIWSAVTAEVLSDTEIRFYSYQKPKAVRYGFGGPEVELDTGEIYTITDYTTVGSGADLTSVTLKFEGGASVTFKPDDGTIIRMKHPGNLVTVTGATIPVFEYTL